VALFSAPATPIISAPGYTLARQAREAGLLVTAIPGASSVLASLSLSGLPTDRFFFEGFLPAKDAARRKRIKELTRVPATLVLFETGPRIAAALADLTSELGTRDAAVCRELTKLHEEVRRKSLDALARDYADNAEIRGEFVIVVAPPVDEPAQAEDVDELLKRALARVSVKDAVGEVSSATGMPRREVYQRALALTKDSGDGTPA
jgi:16S rRNA (cytidine1402-2'-O)-methyltransferase